MLIVQIASRKKTVSSTDTSLNGTISFDSTIGQNTTLVFSYSGTTDIDVNVTSAKGNNITITKDLAAKVVKATVEGQAVRFLIFQLTTCHIHFLFRHHQFLHKKSQTVSILQLI